MTSFVERGDKNIYSPVVSIPLFTRGAFSVLILMVEASMPRNKSKNPVRNYVPPATISRRKQLCLQLIRLFQRIGIEVRITRMRYRDNLHNFTYLYVHSPGSTRSPSIRLFSYPDSTPSNEVLEEVTPTSLASPDPLLSSSDLSREGSPSRFLNLER